MATFFSESTGGFYLDSIHGSNMPADVVECTEAERQAALAGQSSAKRIGLDQNGNVAVVDRPVPDIAVRRASAKQQIDLAAGDARVRFVSAGHLISLEYEQAERQTAAWRSAGNPSGSVPADVQVWADAQGVTAESAAQDIETTASAWRGLLTTIRQIRLAGKAAVDAADDTGTQDDMLTVAQPFIDQLVALQPV